MRGPTGRPADALPALGAVAYGLHQHQSGRFGGIWYCCFYSIEAQLGGDLLKKSRLYIFQKYTHKTFLLLFVTLKFGYPQFTESLLTFTYMKHKSTSFSCSFT